MTSFVQFLIFVSITLTLQIWKIWSLFKVIIMKFQWSVSMLWHWICHIIKTAASFNLKRCFHHDCNIGLSHNLLTHTLSAEICCISLNILQKPQQQICSLWGHCKYKTACETVKQQILNNCSTAVKKCIHMMWEGVI